MKPEQKKKHFDFLAFTRRCIFLLLIVIALPYAISDEPIALIRLLLCALAAFVAVILLKKRQHPKDWRERVYGLVSDVCYAYSAIVLPVVLLQSVIARSSGSAIIRMAGSMFDLLWVAVPIALFILLRRFVLRLPEKERVDKYRCIFAFTAYLVSLFSMNLVVAVLEMSLPIWVMRLGMLCAGSPFYLSLLCFEEMVFATEIKLTSEADETEIKAG